MATNSSFLIHYTEKRKSSLFALQLFLPVPCLLYGNVPRNGRKYPKKSRLPTFEDIYFSTDINNEQVTKTPKKRDLFVSVQRNTKIIVTFKKSKAFIDGLTGSLTII